MPANHGSVQTAQNAIADLTPVQRLRYHNAFKVQSYTGILYPQLTCGMRCHCRSLRSSVASRLDKEGNALPGFLSAMLTGETFGIQDYGQQPTEVTEDQPYAVEGYAPMKKGFVIEQRAFVPPTPAVRLPGFFESDSGMSPNSMDPTGDVYTADPTQHAGSVQIESGVGANGPVNGDIVFEDLPVEEANFGFIDTTFSACPICMGTGYVGGYEAFNGKRIVLNFQHPNANLGDAELDLLSPTPAIFTTVSSYSVVLPAHAVRVDALKVWNSTKQVFPTISVDAQVLESADALRAYCDGRPHTIEVTFEEPTAYTHVEIQIAQSVEDAYWSLPNNTKSGARDLLDSTDSFEVYFSPIVPMVKPGDVLAETTYNKVMVVTSVTGKNERTRAVLGWNCQVRVVQPQELLTLLPRRQKEQVHSPAMPRQAR